MPFARPSTTVKVLLVGGGVALAGALLVAGPSSSAATSLQARPTAAEQHAVTLRSQLGLASGLDYIRSLEAPGRSTTTTDLGIPLTAAEHVELQRRQRLGASIHSIDQQFAMNTAYAGAWLDQAAGGVLRVAFTRSLASASRATLSRMVPGGETPDVKVVRNSVQQLTAILDHVTGDMIKATEQHLPTFENAGIDLAANTVRITILASAPAGTEQEVLATYGPDGVTVVRGTAAAPASGRNYLSGKLYGGEMIFKATGAYCTVTYSDLRSTYNEPYALTAGHCAPNGTGYYQGSGLSRYVGAIHANGAIGHAYTMCDCAAVGPTPASGLGTNQVLVNGNNLRTVQGAVYTYQGEYMCQSGAASYNDLDHLSCGTVMDNAFTSMLSGDGNPSYVLYDAVELSSHVEKGDSGGPVIVDSNIVGIVAAMLTPNITIFSRIQHVSDVGLRLTYS